MPPLRETALGPRPIARGAAKKPFVVVLPFLKLADGSYSYTAAADGFYTVELWGRGGTGGGPANSYSGQSANSGAAGGYARKTFYAKAGQVYSISLFGTSSISGTGVSVTANGGANGTIFSPGSPPAPPSGGTASGGDINTTGASVASNTAPGADAVNGLWIPGGTGGAPPTAPGAGSSRAVYNSSYSAPISPRPGASGGVAIIYVGP